MAELDEFFNKALKIAGDLGKARTARKQKQQDITNLATNKALDLESRRVSTGERRVSSESNLGQQRVELDKARLALRGELGRGQLKISGRQVGVAERGADLKQAGFDRTGALFNRFFPDPDEGGTPGGGGGGSDFRRRSDEGVLESARALTGTSREGATRNPKIGAVIGGARKRLNLQNSLEQDLLNLR